jgi:anti-sigma regulatory factor (Ser/Thr protein kinase)
MERVRVVVSELVTNSVRHARLSPVQRIDLRVSARRDRLWLEVMDDGDGFDPAAIGPHPDQSPGGWGLEIVAQLTDRWGIDFSRSTRVWCEFTTRTPTARAGTPVE